MKTIDKYLTALVRILIGVALIAMFVVCISVVIGRMVFKLSMGWSQDIIRLCFTYVIYLGAGYCLREHGHLNIDFVVAMLPEKVRKILELILDFVMLAFFVIILVYGYQFMMTGGAQKSPYLMIPMKYYYGGIPVSGVLLIFYMINQIIDLVKELMGKTEEKGDTK